MFFSFLSYGTFLLCPGKEQLTQGCLSVAIYGAIFLPLMLHEKCIIKNGSLVADHSARNLALQNLGKWK